MEPAGGDKDIVLVDRNDNLLVAFENGGKQYVSISTNGGASFTARQVNVAPSGVALATGGTLAFSASGPRAGQRLEAGMFTSQSSEKQFEPDVSRLHRRRGRVLARDSVKLH